MAGSCPCDVTCDVVWVVPDVTFLLMSLAERKSRGNDRTLHCYVWAQVMVGQMRCYLRGGNSVLNVCRSIKGISSSRCYSFESRQFYLLCVLILLPSLLLIALNYTCICLPLFCPIFISFLCNVLDRTLRSNGKQSSVYSGGRDSDLVRETYPD
jgi:hypothetical protein